MKRISKRLIASGALEVVATAVPGMKDILVLGKVKSLDEARAADLLIVDVPAAGHADLVPALRRAGCSTRCGSDRSTSRPPTWSRSLSDPARCQVMLVTLPEETPVSEAIETAFAIEDRAGVALGPVVVNQCFEPLPAGVSVAVEDVLADADACGRFVSEREAHDLALALDFRATRHAVQREQIERLRAQAPVADRSSSRSCSPPTSPGRRSTCWPARSPRGIERL